MAWMVIPSLSLMSFCLMWGWLHIISRSIWNFVNSPLSRSRRVCVCLGKLFNLTLTLVKQKLISIRLDDLSRERGKGMHIADGILTWQWSIAWYIVALFFVAIGALYMTRRPRLFVARAASGEKDVASKIVPLTKDAVLEQK